MNEDFATRGWTDHHAAFADGIAKGFDSLMAAMRVLHAKQFDAPWRNRVPSRDCTAR